MKPTEGREAAYVVSSVKDNSKITNTMDFAGLFACVTPWGPKPREGSDTIEFDPVLIRDTDTLDATFGDPRIDPEKYRDLYAVREIVRAGYSVYISKVPSGDPASFMLSIADASNTATDKYTYRTDENGELEIDGITDIASVEGAGGIPAIGFPTEFQVSDLASVYSIDANNHVDMRHAGAFGDLIAVRLTRESVLTDGVETGNLYTVHVGKSTGGKVEEIESLASTGDTVANAFDSNAVLSGTFDMTDNDVLAALSEWKQLSGGAGNYHGAWKISTLKELSALYGVANDAPIYEIVTFWIETMKSGEFIYIPFDAVSPDANLLDAIQKLSAHGAGKGSIIAIDTDDADWYSAPEIISTVQDNGFVLLLRGKDVPTANAPEGMYATYPSSAKIAVSGTQMGFNVAVAMLVNSSVYPLLESERDEDMLGRYIPGMLPCASSGTDIPFDNDKFATAKEQGLVTFKNAKSGGTRTVVSNAPVTCKFLVGGVDYTTEVAVVDGAAVTRITIPKQTDLEGNPVPYEDGVELNISRSAVTHPYAEVTSSITDRLYLRTNLLQLKPKSLGLYAMDIALYSEYDELNPNKNIIVKTRISLAEGLTNAVFIAAMNSVLGSYLSFVLMEPYEEEGKDIVETLRGIVKSGHDCGQPVELSQGLFHVTVDGYRQALEEYISQQYTGNFITELSAMITDNDGNVKHLNETTDESDRRALHYIIKSIAADRKDLTCIFTTPYDLSLDDACDWTNSLGAYSDLWEYGSASATAYEDQSFYCEMYWGWLNVNCVKLNNGVPSKNVKVAMSPAYQVIMKGLASYRSRGTFYPVAGEQGGLLDDSVSVIRNPSSKADRDKLINYHINPIFDLGRMGIQIYGNETLNPYFSDLSAAHIARTLIYIRAQVDLFTNTLKFSLNDLSLWQKWKQYVSSRILEPIASLGGLASYSAAMGYDTTKAELIAQRKINGVLELQFVPDAEIFTVDFVVNSSANTTESSIRMS